MLSLADCKKILDKEAQNLTDKELELIIDLQYRLADILFNKWSEDKK